MVDALADFLERKGKPSQDLEQKLSRAIGKLRGCGFKIDSAPSKPYELVESVFPVILSQQQRQALALGAQLLSDMGFNAQASQLLKIGDIGSIIPTSGLKGDFSPPVDYSSTTMDELVRQLEERCRQQRRFVIRYRNAAGNEKNWDLDRSQLRLHDGVLYLFAFVPNPPTWDIQNRSDVDRNYTFRVDRIVRVDPASVTSWFMPKFPTIKIVYRLSGALANYQPRRSHEQEQYRDPDRKFVDIVTTEDCVFWFRQRIMQYGKNARVLEPQWLVEEIRDSFKQAYMQYSVSHLGDLQ